MSEGAKKFRRAARRKRKALDGKYKHSEDIMYSPGAFDGGSDTPGPSRHSKEGILLLSASGVVGRKMPQVPASVAGRNDAQAYSSRKNDAPGPRKHSRKNYAPGCSKHSSRKNDVPCPSKRRRKN